MCLEPLLDTFRMVLVEAGERDKLLTLFVFTLTNAAFGLIF